MPCSRSSIRSGKSIGRAENDYKLDQSLASLWRDRGKAQQARELLMQGGTTLAPATTFARQMTGGSHATEIRSESVSARLCGFGDSGYRTNQGSLSGNHRLDGDR